MAGSAGATGILDRLRSAPAAREERIESDALEPISITALGPESESGAVSDESVMRVVVLYELLEVVEYGVGGG